MATGSAGASTGRTGSGARAAAAPPIVWGVADDASKFADDGGAWFYGELKGANLSTNRWTLAWDSTAPTTIKELAFLQRAAPKAQAAGVHILLALYAGTPSPTATQHEPTQIMDQLSVHPYPNPSAPADSPDIGYGVTDRFGIPNMDRVKQAVWDAFDGTGQPTTVSAVKPLTLVIDEIGGRRTPRSTRSTS